MSLRTDFDRMKPRLLEAAASNTQDGVAARINLDFMPPLIETLEREARRNTNPKHQLQAIAGIMSVIAANMIKETLDPGTQRAGLDMLLGAINEAVRGGLGHSGNNGVILPGLGN